jgi:signal transduction histidine kinase
MESYFDSLSQVVTNLAINSLQHAFAPGDAGSITIRAELREEDELRIDFSDDGRGIDPSLRARVFEPFFSTRRMHGGSGLGLYIVNRIVTGQLDGSIALDGDGDGDGDGGAGAHFVILIPRIGRHSANARNFLSALSGTPVDER